MGSGPSLGGAKVAGVEAKLFCLFLYICTCIGSCMYVCRADDYHDIKYPAVTYSARPEGSAADRWSGTGAAMLYKTLKISCHHGPVGSVCGRINISIIVPAVLNPELA